MKLMKNPALLFLTFLLFNCSGENPGSEVFKIVEGRNIISGHGMVVSAHEESSFIGASILKKGGNAVDAAIATEFALAVCYPEAGNIGGGGFMVIRMSNGTSDIIDYRERAPMHASRDMYLDPSGNVINGLSTETHLSAAVPGTVDGMIKVHKKYGKLGFREVIQPAIDLAKDGFHITESQAKSLNQNREYFLSKNAVRPSFVKDSAWKAGDMLRQPDLAATLERIRDHGRNGFYSGKTAELIIKEMRRGNGIVIAQDLSGYQAKFRKPLTCEYRGYRIISVPPPSSGGIILCQLLWHD